MKFRGLDAIVAGAGGGMGLEIANQLIDRGINVCMTDIKPQPENISTGPGNWKYLQLDLSDEAAVETLAVTVHSEFPNLAYLVNTIGVLWLGRDQSAVSIDLKVWDQVMNINLRSIVLMTQKFVPLMVSNGGGAMVHFSSIDALKGDPVPQDAYGAAKAALIRLSKSLAVQFAPNNVRSNVILPGPALTPMQERWHGRTDLQEKVSQRIPLGRLGTPEDLANACLFLLSDNADYITGTELIVDGGITATP